MTRGLRRRVAARYLRGVGGHRRIRQCGLALREGGFGRKDALLHRLPFLPLAIAEALRADDHARRRFTRSAIGVRHRRGRSVRVLPLREVSEAFDAAAAVEREQLGRDAFEQEAVVSYEDDGAGKLLEALL